MKNQEQDFNDAAERILQAAEQRFADYGPCKTTMAEIAADCEMSVGNLYRHFANKAAITVACLQRQLQRKLDQGIAAANDCERADDALRAFLLTRLRISHGYYSDTRHLAELVVTINTQHGNVLLDYEERVIEVMRRLIQQGMEQKVFDCLDAKQTAYDIHQAMLRYNYPISLQNHALTQLSEDLERLIQLLYCGMGVKHEVAK